VEVDGNVEKAPFEISEEWQELCVGMYLNGLTQPRAKNIVKHVTSLKQYSDEELKEAIEIWKLMQI